MKVSISKCDNAGCENEISRSLKNLLQGYGGIESLIKPGQRVMVKPNLVIPTKEPGIISNILVLRAILKEVMKVPKCEVFIGESVGVGRDAFDCFKENGIMALAKELDLEVIDLGSTETVEVPFPNHPVIKTLEVSKEVFEIDYMINLPVMKTHMHTRVSLALKNLKGCLPHRSMKIMHLGGVEVGLPTLARIIKPNFNIIDGTIASEGMGPVHGQPKPMNCLIGSEDAFACDVVTSSIMGISPLEVKHLQYGHEIYGNSISLEDYTYDKRLFQELKSDFLMPPTDLNNAFGAHFVDKDTCSGCASAIIGALSRLEQYQDLELIEDTAIIVGQSVEREDFISNPKKILIGSCLRKFKDEADLYVPGCPPPDWDIMGRIYRFCGVAMKDKFFETRIDDYEKM